MANIKFELQEGIITQIAKDTARYVGKGLAASALAAVTGSPAAGLAAFNNIKNMMYDKQAYKTEQEKQKRINEVLKSFGNVLSTQVVHNGVKLTQIEVSVLVDFINDYLESQEMSYRKNLNQKYTVQEVINDITVQLRKRMNYGDVKNAKDWVRSGAKMQQKSFFEYLANVFINLLPTFKNLEIIKRKKSGQYYSPDAD